jgi:hypothetical protein
MTIPRELKRPADWLKYIIFCPRCGFRAIYHMNGECPIQPS